MNIINSNTINIDNIVYNKPIKKNQRYISVALYNNKPIILQLRKIYTTIGIYKENNKYKIDLIIDKSKYNDIFKKIEDNSINILVKNYKLWFNTEDEDEEDEINYNDIKENLYSNIKKSIDYSIITLPIEIKNNIMNIEIYNENKERISWSEIKKNSLITILLEYNGIRYLKTKFNNEWTIKQIKVHNEKNNEDELEKNICHIDYNSDSEDLGDNINIENDEEREYIYNFLKERYKKEKELEKLQKC